MWCRLKDCDKTSVWEGRIIKKCEEKCIREREREREGGYWLNKYRWEKKGETVGEEEIWETEKEKETVEVKEEEEEEEEEETNGVENRDNKQTKK